MISPTRIFSGMVASLVATIVISVIMVMKQMTGMMPQLNPIADLIGIAHGYLGMPATPAVGWLLHFVIGTIVWGVSFALLSPDLPGSNAVKGPVFGIVAWLMMMLVFMPIAGNGLFGMRSGMAIAAMSLMIHLVFGAVLGVVFGKLTGRRAGD